MRATAYTLPENTHFIKRVYTRDRPPWRILTCTIYHNRGWEWYRARVSSRYIFGNNSQLRELTYIHTLDVASSPVRRDARATFNIDRTAASQAGVGTSGVGHVTVKIASPPTHRTGDTARSIGARQTKALQAHSSPTPPRPSVCMSRAKIELPTH